MRIIRVTVLGGLLAAGLPSATLAQDAELSFDWHAFAQLTAEHEDGDGGIDFGADRIRLRTETRYQRFTGVTNLDFGVDNLGDRQPGAMANVILDLFLRYDFAGRHRVTFGQFKTPLGMDFNVSGSSLDITKRGSEAGLILQRNPGVMVSGRGLGNFGYDFGVFNIPGRSPATSYLPVQEGEENAVVARGHFDSGYLHVEAAWGIAPAAGGPGTADYRVADAAMRYVRERWNVKAEWVEGDNVRGNPNRDERVWYLHGAYALSDSVELVARHYASRSRLAGASTDLGNTWLGATWHVYDTPRLRGRLQLNYVIAGGDEAAYTGVRGFRDDALLAQLQIYVAK